MTQYSQAPHVEGVSKMPTDAPNAALLIDFDNVTLGMRSDLSKELKTLLQSDVIRGKVTVQRAYADWRRYPQYIVPLSEASVDLIFAPAYGSSKKNATDIRMAIDGVELVFIRPEIGTYILLTGDSDFSSLVLKLKEYGKYVIGVGIQESSSDILVQNCDEYYSYTSLTGLRKTTDSTDKPADPWELVGEALARMNKRNDVMRSDRLKQVMIEIDPSFDEGGFGFSKFSKFLAEAASRGIIGIHKLENGQYEVSPARKGSSSSGGTRERKSRPAGRRTRSDRSRSDRPVRSEPSTESDTSPSQAESSPDSGGDPLRDAYDLMLECLRMLKDKGRDSVRDSDVKRKMLERSRGFDEAELGFAKFSKFLIQAEEHGVVNLEKTETGNYRVSLKSDDQETSAEPEASVARESDEGSSSDRASQTRSESPRAPEPRQSRSTSPTESSDRASRAPAGRLGPRGGSGRRTEGEGPVLFEGQGVDSKSTSKSPSDSSSASKAVVVESSGLPTGKDAIVAYLTNSYKGVGKKTAEALVEAFGDSLFDVFQNTPERVNEVVPRRAEQVLAEWRADHARRVADRGADTGADSQAVAEKPAADRGGRGGRQSKGGGQSRGERKPQRDRNPRDDRRPRNEGRAAEDRQAGRTETPAEKQSAGQDRSNPPLARSEKEPPAEGGSSETRGDSDSARPTPRGRGGARRTRRGSRGGSSGPSGDKS